MMIDTKVGDHGDNGDDDANSDDSKTDDKGLISIWIQPVVVTKPRVRACKCKSLSGQSPNSKFRLIMVMVTIMIIIIISLKTNHHWWSLHKLWWWWQGWGECKYRPDHFLISNPGWSPESDSDIYWSRNIRPWPLNGKSMRQIEVLSFEIFLSYLLRRKSGMQRYDCLLVH